MNQAPPLFSLFTCVSSNENIKYPVITRWKCCYGDCRTGVFGGKLLFDGSRTKEKQQGNFGPDETSLIGSGLQVFVTFAGKVTSGSDAAAESCSCMTKSADEEAASAPLWPSSRGRSIDPPSVRHATSPTEARRREGVQAFWARRSIMACHCDEMSCLQPPDRWLT